jgi:predicted ArsR family transcriptional regulator
MKASGVGETQRQLLQVLKRRGPETVPRLAVELGLNGETVRGHLEALVAAGLAERRGSVPKGRGRPEVVYGLSVAAERLFPRREGEMLAGLAAHLEATGHADLLRGFLETYIGARRPGALARVEGLEGRERLEESARLLSELGFMAVVEDAGAGACLRLCHCPIRELVGVTKLPCRVEQEFVAELVGSRPQRLSYIPSGDASCSYAVRGEA